MSTARVLVLDDSRQVHDRIQRAFTGIPVAIFATDSLAKAQAEILSTTPPDLVILDLQMPTLGGAMVGRAFKRRVPIPIVIYSSESPARLQEVLDYVGAEAAVSKSAPDKELVDTVLRVLRAARCAPDQTV